MQWEYQTTWPSSWETYMQVKKQHVELDREEWTGSRLEKEYIKAAYCYSAYLIYLTPCINLYAEYIMWNARIDEAQAGIEIARGNINNLRYADDTTMAESEEKLKSLLIKVREESEKLA